MNQTIKFGTDGWRAIIAKDFTTANVLRVAEATALWLKQQSLPQKIVIGHDCRFGGQLFMETAARVFASHGLEVLYSPVFVSTPMVSMGTLKLHAGLGIVITASHNPPAYNGYKIKAHYGGPASPVVIAEVEAMIPQECSSEPDSFSVYESKGLIQSVDLEGIYLDAVRKAFDLDSIAKSGMQWAYDAMYGAGQQAMRTLMPEINFLHAEENPGFDGQAPEPIHRNLQELSEMIQISGDIASGLATDGDADRIGLYDSQGNFVDSHHIILLLIRYLVEEKGYKGKVVTSFSCSSRISKLCAHYGLEQVTTKIGFKYISDIMVEEDVLLGGEESGGIAVKGHIPERDGIWMGLLIWEFMAKSGKSLEDLIDEVYEITGPFALDRYDLQLSQEQKDKVVDKCATDSYTSFGPYAFFGTEKLDGYKYDLGQGRSVMIRPSGTEPVLRVYAEASNQQEVIKILESAKKVILES